MKTVRKLFVLCLTCLENFLFHGIWRGDEFAEKLTTDGICCTKEIQ